MKKLFDAFCRRGKISDLGEKVKFGILFEILPFLPKHTPKYKSLHYFYIYYSKAYPFQRNPSNNASMFAQVSQMPKLQVSSDHISLSSPARALSIALHTFPPLPVKSVRVKLDENTEKQCCRKEIL